MVVFSCRKYSNELTLLLQTLTRLNDRGADRFKLINQVSTTQFHVVRMAMTDDPLSLSQAARDSLVLAGFISTDHLAPPKSGKTPSSSKAKKH